MEDYGIIGKVHVYGDHINTDVIIPGKYTKTLDYQALADHVLEDLDPEFKNNVKPGDILVAGDNFGCGSSREQAPLALKSAGVTAVIANYFARIFFRNAINVGLPVLEVRDFIVESGQEVGINLITAQVKNFNNNKVYNATQMPEVMIDILKEDGLVNYLRKYGAYQIRSKTNIER